MSVVIVLLIIESNSLSLSIWLKVGTFSNLFNKKINCSWKESTILGINLFSCDIAVFNALILIRFSLLFFFFVIFSILVSMFDNVFAIFSSASLVSVGILSKPSI